MKGLWIPLAIFTALCVVELGAILRLNHGQFTYTQDDAYIQLALAESIARGHYGVNPGEISAPSSSIAWPVFLALFVNLPFGVFAPLVVNFFVGIVTLVVFHAIVKMAIARARDPVPRVVPWIVVSLLIPCVNLIGMTFNGMEHTVQMLVAALVLLGLLRVSDRDPLPWWFLAALSLGPVVRYELMALSVPAMVVLWRHRQRRAAVFSGGVIVLTVGGFSALLKAFDLGLLPTSVLAKSPYLSSGSDILEYFNNLRRSLLLRQGAVLCVWLLLLLKVALSGERSARDRELALWGAAAVSLHLVVGRIGWMDRYEIYIWTVVLLLTLFLHGQSLFSGPGNLRWLRWITVGVTLVGGVCYPYLRAIVTTPFAAKGIFQQQYQMHRFATEFHRVPFAANDIGVVSFRNDQYVMDMWGLSSRVALETGAHQSGPGWVAPDWIEATSREKGVKFAMLYDRLFPNLPSDWIIVGDLHVGPGRSYLPRDVVAFYAVGEENLLPLIRRLEEFRETLPPGLKFVFRERDRT